MGNRTWELVGPNEKQSIFYLCGLTEFIMRLAAAVLCLVGCTIFTVIYKSKLGAFMFFCGLRVEGESENGGVRGLEG